MVEWRLNMEPGTKVRLKDKGVAWVFPFDSFWDGQGYLVIFYIADNCSAYIYDSQGKPCDERISGDEDFDIDWTRINY